MVAQKKGKKKKKQRYLPQDTRTRRKKYQNLVSEKFQPETHKETGESVKSGGGMLQDHPNRKV